MYDDVANDPMNPRPGTLINHPHGSDLREEMRIDYSGEAVTVENFLALLAGDSIDPVASKGIGWISSGRKIEAGPNDRIFVYYSDHGAPGVLGMPNGKMVYADEMHKAITRRAEAHGFREMTLFVEACESGSMFKGLLKGNLEVMAVTAANSHESSWGTYCPGMKPEPPEGYLTCLGDLFSVSWMEDADISDLTHESLRTMFKKVRQRTSRNFTYVQGSHVERFGDLSISDEYAADFLGELNNGQRPSDETQLSLQRYQDAVEQREADLVHLRTLALHGDKIAAEELETEIKRRAAIDDSVRRAVELLLHDADTKYTELSFLITDLEEKWSSMESKHEDSSWSEASVISALRIVMTGEIPARHSLALVDDWDCLRGMVTAWEDSCGRLDQYSMRHTRTFANLCNVGVHVRDFAVAATSSCKGPEIVVF